MKLRSFRPRLNCPPLIALALERPNLITISGDFHRGCLLTFESVSPSKTELSTLLKADWLRPNLMKEEPIVLRLSLESVSSLRSSMPCLFIMYSNSFGDSLKILRLPSSFNGVSTEEDASIQLQRNANALKAQSAICDKISIDKIAYCVIIPNLFLFRRPRPRYLQITLYIVSHNYIFLKFIIFYFYFNRLFNFVICWFSEA